MQNTDVTKNYQSNNKYIHKTVSIIDVISCSNKMIRHAVCASLRNGGIGVMSVIGGGGYLPGLYTFPITDTTKLYLCTYLPIW